MLRQVLIGNQSIVIQLQNLSVIIPTLNADEQLPAILQNLRGYKVLVVDGGSTDATQEVAQKAKAKWLISEKGRGFQIANGIEKACQIWGSSNWILILHADTQLDETAKNAISRHIQSEDKRAGYFKLAYRSNDFASKVVTSLANWRANTFGLPFGDQGLLIHSSLLAEMGGYPRQSLMEDVTISRLLGKQRLVCLGQGLTTCPQKYENDGWMRRSIIHLVCLTMHLSGMDPKRVMRFYRKFS